MERSTIVRVHEGLHARPATRFVRLAKSFESEVEIVKAGKSVSAKSSVKLMLLGVKENQEVTVRANGADAAEAVEALIGYLENPRAGLEEDDATGEHKEPNGEAAKPVAVTLAPEAAQSGGLRGIAASEGVAVGPAFAHFPPEIRPQARTLTAEEAEAEIVRFGHAVAAVQVRMDKALASESLAGGDRGIVAALRDLAADDTLIGEAEAMIRPVPMLSPPSSPPPPGLPPSSVLSKTHISMPAPTTSRRSAARSASPCSARTISAWRIFRREPS